MLTLPRSHPVAHARIGDLIQADGDLEQADEEDRDDDDRR